MDFTSNDDEDDYSIRLIVIRENVLSSFLFSQSNLGEFHESDNELEKKEFQVSLSLSSSCYFAK